MSQQPEPFTLHVPDEAIADLRERLARTRFPDPAPGEPWAYGTDVGYLRGLVDYWRDGFDWRAEEARLNAFPQYKVPLHGIDLHFLHVPGQGPDPLPLLLSHGWPGSVLEFLDLIPRLTDPARFGGDPADAFTVVAPSLPGYGLSFAPGQPLRRRGDRRLPRRADDRCSATGASPRRAATGARSSPPASRYAHADRLVGIHLNLMPVRRDPAIVDRPDARGAPLPRRARALAQGGDRLPVDPGHPAADAGLRAHRFAGGARRLDRREVPRLVRLRRRRRVGVHQGPAARQHRPLLVHRRHRLLVLALLRAPARALADPGRHHGVPTGYCEFPREILRPPRSVAERTFADIRRWSVMPRGGHFAAMEQPDALAQELREFFRPLRASP